MNLLVGIPALNESATIQDVVRRIPRQIEGVEEVTIVVVDDGSTDRTGDLAREAGATVLRHPQNSGVGVAFQTMVRHALAVRADLLVTLDGDGQFNPEDIAKLIAPIVEERALVCTASRFRDASLVPTMPWVKKWGNRQVANLVNMLTGHRYADVSCGFRAYHREALLRLTVYHSFTYTHETFLDLAAKKVPIVEVPLVVRGTREFGKSKIASSVLRYGARTAKIMLLTYRDQAPLRLCAWMALPLVLIGVLLLVGSFLAFQHTGSWLKWAAFAGGAALGLAVLTLFFGFMADIATRLRRNQEEILYWLRRGVVDVPPRR
ncbi:MAG: glycosyltransferase family 2 protein, partial [Myxococcales bacterium]|nr:glycosyltransferase family 2 protein [Myxococcales bacterium]